MNNRISTIREKEGLSRKAFGEKLGVSGDVINNLERGRVELKPYMAKLICQIYNINEEWLLNGTGEMEKPVIDEFTEIMVKIDHSDPKAKQAIIDYMHLTDSDKELFWKFVERYIDINKKE